MLLHVLQESPAAWLRQQRMRSPGRTGHLHQRCKSLFSIMPGSQQVRQPAVNSGLVFS
jgi:hypothetical protein